MKLSDVVADFRFAIRTLTRSPWFTALAVVTLAAGIGSTTALFSLVDAVLLRPLPFNEPHRLVEIWGRDDQRTGMRVPGPILEALRARAKTLHAIGTHDPSSGVLKTVDGAIDIRGEAVSANFLEVFGITPLAGRGFIRDDERAGAPAVMLVSFSFWRHYLAGDPNVVGRTIDLDSVPHVVVGVMPPAFRTTFFGAGPAFWTPYAGNRSRARERELGYELVARLAPGATLEQARREIDLIASGIDGLDGWRQARRIDVIPLRNEVVGRRAYTLTLLLGAVAVVLAVACANLAQLLLARSDRRITEFATRKAMGAGSLQLFRLVICESLLLSLIGGAVGIVVANWLLPILIALAPAEIPRLIEASFDARVLGVAIAISVLTGCVFGLAPALRLSRLSVVQAMKPTTGVPSTHRARFRSALVVVQVTAAVTLCVLGGLLGQTFLTLLPASPGFATESRWAFIWSINENQFPDAANRRRRVSDWIERVAITPGVISVAVGSGIPFGDDEPRNVAVRRPDDVRAADQATVRADVRAVSSNFFELFQIPLMYGRPFAITDRAEAPRVAIVNQTLARRLDGSGDVIGQFIRIGNATTAPLYQIVGVVADTRWWGTTLAPLDEVYTPLAQDRASFGFLIVHSSFDETALTKTVRTTFYAAVPGAALPADRRVIALDEMIGRSIAAPRFSAVLIGSFSTMGLILAVIGLFGLVAYSVSQQRQELGIRTALGARPVNLIAVCIRSAMALTIVGIGSGLIAGAYLTRLVESQLYGIDPFDVPTFVGAALLMMVTAGIAAYIPARWAVHADPMRALRYE